MKIAISGAGGFVGQKASEYFTSKGYKVTPIHRSWFADDTQVLAEKISGSDVIIHLAGAPILKRWTKSHRKAIYDSRIQTTQKITQAMALLKAPPHTLICASAVGIYPDTGVHDETSNEIADDFLGEVCTDWELAAARVPPPCRSISFRFGVILGKDGGALSQMLPPFRLGLGGRIGSGKQMMSWIHMDDVIGAFQFALDNPKLQEPVNITAPHPVSNREFTKTLAKVLKRPAVIPVPVCSLKLLFGKGASVLTGGQRAIPGKLLDSGYQFRYPELGSALWDLLK